MQKFRKSISNHPLVWTCIFLFTFSFSIRSLHGLRFVTFGQDQARDVYLMRKNVDERKLVIGYGPKASVGNFYLPPFYYQLATLAAYLTRGWPLVMQWLIIIVESFTSVLLFLWLRIVVRERSALMGALLYTVAAGVIEYATFAWNPNMIPFFTTLAGLCWFLAVFKQKYQAIPWGVVALTIAISLHYQAIVLLPFALLVFIITLRRSFKILLYWILGVLLASIVIFPYFHIESISGWKNTKAMVAFFHESNSRYFDKVSKPEFLISFLPSLTERFLFVHDTYFYLFGRIFFFIGFGCIFWRIFKKRHLPLTLILVYFLTIFIMLRVYKGDKVDYYMSTLYILPAVLLAVLAEQWKRFSFILLLCVAVAGSVIAFGRPPQNGLQNILTASKYIQQTTPEGRVRLLFQDLDYGNLFAFGLASQGVAVDQSVRQTVDICAPDVPCAWSGKYLCEYSNAHTRSVIEKGASNYKELGVLKIPNDMTVVVGNEDVASVRARFPFYGKLGDAGSDTLLPQLYEKN